jgi:hypothetical protein
MATTDARPGFRLPWSSERSETDSADGTATKTTADVDAASTPAVADDATAAVSSSNETADVAEESPAGSRTASTADEALGGWPQTDRPTDPAPLEAGAADPRPEHGPAPSRKPNRLQEGLVQAMRSAAETAREETFAKLQADAKTFIEEIHARSATEATELRQQADADVTEIRDWSKAEIARIREETDRRIDDRKHRLETDTEEHAARIEARIERVHARIGWFETEMAAFFEGLLSEDDPARLAGLAERMPEPPVFDAPGNEATDGSAAAVADPPDAVVHGDVAAHEVVGEAALDPDPVVSADDAGPVADDVEVAQTIMPAVAEDRSEEPRHDVAFGDEPDGLGDDPRLAAFGLAPDVAAAAEAEAFAAASAELDEIPTIDDDALAARLAGLVAVPADKTPADDLRTTRVAVVGLVSVASIASFKRHLGQLAGVRSVGVSSGPSGEFIFAVAHEPTVVPSEVIPTLPGFSARVTKVSDGAIDVTARDPESAS